MYASYTIFFFQIIIYSDSIKNNHIHTFETHTQSHYEPGDTIIQCRLDDDEIIIIIKIYERAWNDCVSNKKSNTLLYYTLHIAVSTDYTFNYVHFSLVYYVFSNVTSIVNDDDSLRQIALGLYLICISVLLQYFLKVHDCSIDMTVKRLIIRFSSSPYENQHAKIDLSSVRVVYSLYGLKRSALVTGE